MKKTDRQKINPTKSPLATTPAELTLADSDLGVRLLSVLTSEGSSPSHRAIAEFLLRNPVRATVLGIEELAANADTSKATLSRFARSLGMAGFAGLRSEMADVLQGISQPMQKLRSAVDRNDADGSGGKTTALQSVQSCLHNANATAMGLDGTALVQAAARLVKANNVYVMGFGLSAHLAAILSLHLQPLLPQLVNVVEFGGTDTAAGRLMNIGKGDVLLVISFPRYSVHGVQLTRYALDRGATTLAITDSIASPLAELATMSFMAASVHGVFPSSHVSALMVIEALVATVMVRDKTAVLKATKLTQAMSSFLHSPGRALRRGASGGRH
jgi:DNA-binding MurR/RpiR family transcriptional regulator